MIKYHGLHVELQLVEESKEDWVNLLLLKVLAEHEVEIVLDEAPDLFLDRLAPAVLGNLVEILGHDLLGLYKLVVVQWERVDLSPEFRLLRLPELGTILSEKQVDIERVPEELVRSDGPCGQ